jgi:GT2 family glycosyltransferase
MPVHNAYDYVEKSLRFLLSNYPETPIYLVDDKSDQETKALLETVARTNPDQVKLFRHERQQLFTRSVNHGIREAAKDQNVKWFFIVNSDCQFSSQPFESLLQAVALDPNIGLAGYTDTPESSDTWFTKVKFPNYITGHCLCIPRSVIENIGVFKEDDYGAGPCMYPEFTNLKGLAHIGSDREYSQRVQEAGLATVYVNYPALYHEAGKSWKHDLGWLHAFNLEMLWEPKNTL